MRDKIASAEVENLPSLFLRQAHKFRNSPFLWVKKDGSWKSRSWSEVANDVSALANGLKVKGVREGDRVVIVSENRPEWLIADLAIMSIGAITTPACIAR